MNKKIHFISGLPRSGSTLLGVLLNQHPEIYCSEYSTPICSLFTKMLSVMSEGEYQTEFTDRQKRATFHAVMNSYHDAASRPSLLIDHNRAWCSKMQLIHYLYPHARIICCVRDPVWVINSFERIIGGQPTLSSKLVPIEHRATVYQRVDYLLSPTGAFGFAYRALKEAFFGQFASKLILVDYDRLVTHPLLIMQKLEKALCLSHASYNIETLSYAPPTAYDEALGTPGLHYVAPKVEPQKHRLILPPSIVNRLAGGNFWKEPTVASRSITIL